MTLRTRLALLIAVAIAVALLLQGIFSYFTFQQALYTSLDHDLGAYFGQTLSEYNRQQPRPTRDPDAKPPAQPPLNAIGRARLIQNGLVIRSWAEFPTGIPLPDSQPSKPRIQSLGTWRIQSEPLPSGQYLQATISEQSVLSSLSNYRQSIGITILGVVVFGAWMAWLLTGLALRPLRLLTQTARQVANSGDLSLRVQTKTKDELGDLSQTFNEMLERLNEFLTRETLFTRNASHELRTPLTSLTLQLSAYKQGLSNSTETLEVVSQEVERMIRLTESLLTLAREGRANLIALDLAALASQIALEAKVEYIGETQLVIPADPILIRQTLRNLLENAEKYAPQSQISINLSIQAAQAVLAVRDTGAGLTQEAMARATQAFYRVPHTRVAGSGLGLSVVEQIARVHGGHLELKNNLPHGLEVQIWLPLAQETP